jgi:hypothetical protein
MRKKKEKVRRVATKTYLYTTCVGGFYQFKVFKVEDAAHQVYYIGNPLGHGGTRIADTEEELKKLLEAEVPIINDFLSKVR